MRPENIDRLKRKPSRVHLLHDPHVLERILLLVGQAVAALSVLRHDALKLLPPQAHGLVRERRCPDTEKCTVVRQRIVDLAVRDAPSHHDICRRVRLGEHVLYLLARPHIPVRHIVVEHVLLPFRPIAAFSFCHSALSHSLHDLEGLLRVQTHTDQIRHDIIARTDRRRDRRLSLLDQRLCVAEPNISSM